MKKYAWDHDSEEIYSPNDEGDSGWVHTSTHPNGVRELRHKDAGNHSLSLEIEAKGKKEAKDKIHSVLKKYKEGPEGFKTSAPVVPQLKGQHDVQTHQEGGFGHKGFAFYKSDPERYDENLVEQAKNMGKKSN